MGPAYSGPAKTTWHIKSNRCLNLAMSAIPGDLARAQEEWWATYGRLATQPHTAVRRQLIHLSSEVLFHPHWQGRWSAAWAALHGARNVRTTS
jgi:hypothetical protein